MDSEIKNQHGERLDYHYHPADRYPDTLFILAHGVTGNKDRPLLFALAEGLARAGIPALRISFSGNGLSEGRFQDSTVTKEVEDLGAVLDRVSHQRIGYVGHSMGAAVGVLRASRDPRIQFLISLAGMVHTRAFAQREFGSVTPDQGCMWDEPDCPLSKQYMDDMEKVNSVADLASKIHVPWLLVHGSEDDVVPIQDSQDIFAKANEPKQLIEIPRANHVFAEPHTAEMVKAVTEWIENRLAGR
jgi:pimeloyl-ACP methyl ester carboxylesterase